MELVSKGVTLGLAEILFCRRTESGPIPAQPILDLLASAGIFRKNKDYFQYWTELTGRYLQEYPHFAIHIFAKRTRALSRTLIFVLTLQHCEAQTAILNIIKRNPESSWKVVTGLLEPLNKRRASNILHWLGPNGGFGGNAASGPLSFFKIDDVLRWIDDMSGRKSVSDCSRVSENFSYFRRR